MTDPTRPPGASVPTDFSATGGDPVAEPLRGAVEVLADRAGRVGLLSYRVPDTLDVHIGDAVNVPFGTRTKYGMVVGPSQDPAKATKEILEVFGKRADPRDVALARNIARFHFAELATVLARLAPRTGKGADPLRETVVTVADAAPRPVLHGVAGASRRLLIRAPLVDPAALAAHEAARLAKATPHAQVLVLCPTTRLVTSVLAALPSGAARLDARARVGAWKGFATGTVRIGVGTRAAALYSAAHLAGIVVIDEDHPGHLESAQPHTHARDIASARTRALGVPLTLISAAPTPAALGSGVTVGTAGTRADWPVMRLVDRGLVDPIQRWAPPALQAAISAENKAGRTPWVVAQRKAAVRRCTRCGAARPCPMCDSSLCRHVDTAPCHTCRSTDPAKMVGWDAARISDLLNGSPHADRADDPPPRVKVVNPAELVDAHHVGLVVLFDIDAALGMPELIPETKAASLLMAAAQAAGRDGTVMAITDSPASATLVDLFGPRDQTAVARRALAAARSAGLPPFGRLVTIRTAQARAPLTRGWPGHVLGPARSADEWELLVRIPADRLLDLAGPITRLRRGGKVRITVT